MHRSRIRTSGKKKRITRVIQSNTPKRIPIINKKPASHRKKTSDNHFFSSLGIACILLGIVIWLFPHVYKTISQQNSTVRSKENSQSSFQQTASSAAVFHDSPIQIDTALTQTKIISKPPIRIVIPSLQMDIPIIESKIVNGFWELSETTASHGQGSAYPGNEGNIVIFAHAREGLFLSLRQAKMDGLIYILTNESWHRYRIINLQEVTPNDTTVVAQTKKETLTLFTCTGFLDNKRLIVTAIPYRP